MTCDQVRELIGADPQTVSPELSAHLNDCPKCQAYREQMLALNAKIRRALELDWQKLQRTAPPGTPPEAVGAAAQQTAPHAAAGPTAATAGQQPAPRGATARPTALGPQSPATRPSARSNVSSLPRSAPRPVARAKRPRLLAIGASLAAGLVIAFTLWLTQPQQTLAAEIVTHVEGEPNSWSKTQPVTAERLDAVLRKSGVKLGSGMQPVVYANSCWFRGHFVPHFVVSTKDGPVTVMILANERIPAAQQFNESGYSGLLVPARTGSVAVLSRTPMALEQPATAVVRALQSAD